MESILIIGPGKVGTSLFRALKERSFSTLRLCGHHPQEPQNTKPLYPQEFVNSLNATVVRESSLIFITVQDSAIAETVHSLRSLPVHNKIIVHTSGLLSAEILSDLKKAGALTGSLHPFQSFPQKYMEPTVWNNIYCTYQGDPAAVDRLEAICKKLNCLLKPISVEQKIFLHLAATIAANHSVALWAMAEEIIAKSLGPSDRAAKLLRPVIRQITENYLEHPVQNILSGPVQRGDIQTVRDHIEILDKNASELEKDIYVKLSRWLTENPGFPVSNRQKLKDFLDQYDSH